MLGYVFSDVAIVEQALSHRSVGQANNERLEFLGDSLLNFFIAEILFQRFPRVPEGELSRVRASLVKGETLAELAREMDLGKWLLLGGGELKSGGHRRQSILADVVEALIAAIYLDGGIEESRRCVFSWFESRLAATNLFEATKDPKTRLQEYLQERGRALPEYAVIDELGQSHAREYRVDCRIEGADGRFVAQASSKRNAEKMAAKLALKHLGLDS